MQTEQPDKDLTIDQYVESLKSRIPAAEHGALESRAEELRNDPSADESDVIDILRQEFQSRK